MMTQVQIQNEPVCISHCTNKLWKVKQSTNSPPTMDKIFGQITMFYTVTARKILNLNHMYKHSWGTPSDTKTQKVNTWTYVTSITYKCRHTHIWPWGFIKIMMQGFKTNRWMVLFFRVWGCVCVGVCVCVCGCVFFNQGAKRTLTPWVRTSASRKGNEGRSYFWLK